MCLLPAYCVLFSRDITCQVSALEEEIGGCLGMLGIPGGQTSGTIAVLFWGPVQVTCSPGYPIPFSWEAPDYLGGLTVRLRRAGVLLTHSQSQK